MRKFKAAILSVAPHQIDYVFTPEQLQEIAEITELRDRYAEINAGIQGGNLPFCPNCGRENASGDAFCAGCGTRLSK